MESLAADEVLAFMRSHEALLPLLNEVLLCSFWDPHGMQEGLLLRICEFEDREDLGTELAEFYLRGPRARRNRNFGDLAGRLSVDV